MAGGDNDGDAPQLRREHPTDKIGPKLLKETDKLQHQFQGHGGGKGKSDDKKQPAGGFDETPLPRTPPGYTLKFTFHKAENLPFADFNTLSSDPYILAVLKSDLPKRHKQDPDLKWRTPTIHRNTNPEWNAQWIVTNVPKSGFDLKCRLYDEDPSDYDDRLGNAHVIVDHIDDNWKGISQGKYELKKRMASKRAYTIRGCAALFNKNLKMNGHVIISVENLGRTKDENGGRMYTIGPLAWTRHFSPLIGRLAGTKDTEAGKNGKETEKYNFQAVQIQLRGPVPADLYHRYVEFKPFVAGMFTSHSLRGRLLNRALHHQHARIYNYDKSTKYGSFDEPCIELTKVFLDLVHYDEGGRIFTYVLTLDGHLRFTETGKEFGIDMLSKHTMHSDVNIYIACSGEFFIRRIKHAREHQQDKSVDPDQGTHEPAPEPEEDNQQEESDMITTNGKGHSETGTGQSKDPSHYELIIDNDSGTYRPNAKKLPMLRDFLNMNLPGMKVVTLDCQGDEEKMNKLKNEQRERKKKTSKQVMYMQNKSDSSLSSSDEEYLDARARGTDVDESKAKRHMHKMMDGGTDQHHNKPADGEAAGGAQNEKRQ
ncbi:hypothetical protein LTR10_023098 [Elasticomyces elasticus]|uniref:C2 domain-containing protein n=1 Tax=Exophiala sideris TaxID=1016849 RepID=A0ABR0J9I4_9EURO|nr:hypothetical protein LTR10_023098 [Elasticomyces elasticus]KAK5020997.1 hypothetical protein LTS07_011310 [Exophiala sideris]KAK5023306.1 hypothetical protein LTR13_011264 [Exophiala sideris]KAK5059341.1 hypothetical protein LTR69_005929 [Exophiala sideris]KAK5176156.1 hypothetical protein LTR44_011297 [Eurotiomycetes sp. CCFEE 6388]